MPSPSPPASTFRLWWNSGLKIRYRVHGARFFDEFPACDSQRRKCQSLYPPTPAMSCIACFPKTRFPNRMNRFAELTAGFLRINDEPEFERLYLRWPLRAPQLMMTIAKSKKPGFYWRQVTFSVQNDYFLLSSSKKSSFHWRQQLSFPCHVERSRDIFIRPL